MRSEVGQALEDAFQATFEAGMSVHSGESDKTKDSKIRASAEMQNVASMLVWELEYELKRLKEKGNE